MEATTSSHGFTFVEQSGKVDCYQLPTNQLRVLLLPKGDSGVATLMVTYHVGSRNEGVGHTGATHFLEHLMFKGTDRHNKENGQILDYLLERVGARVNATTSFDRTNYYEMLPTEHLPMAIILEADRMRGALLDVDEMESERTVILNEFDRGDNQPLRKIYHTMWSTAYMAHPYHHPVIGWRSDIETVSRRRLKDFYDTYYWPNNATISVIGDFDREEVLQALADAFGSIPASPNEPNQEAVREPEQRGLRRFEHKKAGELGALIMGFKSPPGAHPDTDALDVLAILLSFGKKSLLYQSLTDPGLATNVDASASRLRDPGLFYMYVMLTSPDGHAEAESIMLDVLADIATNGVKEEDVQRSINQLKAQYAFGMDGSFGIAAQLNEAIAAGDWKLFTTYLDRIQQITPDEVQRVASQYLVSDQATIGYYLPV